MTKLRIHNYSGEKSVKNPQQFYHWNTYLIVMFHYEKVHFIRNVIN